MPVAVSPKAIPIKAGTRIRLRLEISPLPHALGNPVRWENQIPTTPATPNTAIIGQPNSAERGSRSRPAPTQVINSWTTARKPTRTSQTRADATKPAPPGADRETTSVREAGRAA